jgi:hypothetical protein
MALSLAQLSGSAECYRDAQDEFLKNAAATW